MTEDRIRQAICAELVRLLSEERQRQGLSMNALAERAGLSQSFISMFESQPANPTIDTLLRIAGVLGLDAGKMLTQAIAKCDGLREVAKSARTKMPRGASGG